MSSTKVTSYPRYVSIGWILIVLRFMAVSSIFLVDPPILSSLDAASNNEAIGWDETILEHDGNNTKGPNIIPFHNGTGLSLSNQQHRSLKKCVRTGKQLLSAVRNLPNMTKTNIDICSKYIAIDARVSNTGMMDPGFNIVQKIVNFRCRFSKCVLDAKGLSRHFYGHYSTVTFQGIVFINGNDFGFGGSLRFYYSTLTLNRCDMINNTASGGGGMHLWATNLFLYGNNNAATPTLFENNGALFCGSGGAIFVDSASTVTTMEGYFLFHNNTACDKGGAIKSTYGSIRLSGVVFRNNVAGLFGGAVMTEDSNSTLNNVAFLENNARRGAASAHNGVGLLQINNITIVNNTAYENGMVYIIETRTDVRSTTFSKSSENASAYDLLLGKNLRIQLPFGVGEIDQQSGLNLPLSPPNRQQTRRDLEHEEALEQRSLKPCVFTFASLMNQVNACDGIVAGISCIINICAKLIRIPIESPTTSPIVSGIDLTNKNIKLVCRQTKGRCTLDGQGLSRIFYGGNASVTFRDIIFSNGYNANAGGAVMMTARSMVNFWNCSFYNNTASSGSAVAVYGSTTLVVGGTRTKFLNNYGDTPPLFIYFSNLDLSDAFFDQNKAAEYGGGGVLLFGSSINLFNVTFSNQSTAQSDDCSIFTTSDSTDFASSTTCLNVY